MKNIKMRVITWIGLLAVCLLPIGARAAEHYQSGIIGQVEVPGAYNVIGVSNGRSSIAVLVETDGFFVVDLKPGRYVLTPYFYPQVGPLNSFLTGTSIQVMVTRHHFTIIDIPSPQLPFPPGTPFLHGPHPVPVPNH
jgi:hypothetical protein